MEGLRGAMGVRGLSVPGFGATAMLPEHWQGAEGLPGLPLEKQSHHKGFPPC